MKFSIYLNRRVFVMFRIGVTGSSSSGFAVHGPFSLTVHRQVHKPYSDGSQIVHGGTDLSFIGDFSKFKSNKNQSAITLVLVDFFYGSCNYLKDSREGMSLQVIVGKVCHYKS